MADQWIVKVTTDPETARGRYREFCGENLYGPHTLAEATALKAEIDNEFMRILAAEGTDAFVYGTPCVTTERLLSDDDAPGNPAHRLAYRAARNWYLPLDEHEPDMIGTD